MKFRSDRCFIEQLATYARQLGPSSFKTCMGKETTGQGSS